MRYLYLLSISFFFFFSACKNDKGLSGIDAELFEKAKNTSGFTWFNNSTAYLTKSSGSGHSNPFLRTRFDAISTNKLDSTGKVMDSTVFEEGSLIVKELYDSSKNIERYAVLYKDSNSEYADANGWVWGYINSDGTVAAPAEDKGAACLGCHSQSGNIDYSLMNKYFP